jgi:hypothetical protein
MHSSPRLHRLVPVLATVAMAVAALLAAFMAGRSSGEQQALAQTLRHDARPTAAVLRTVVVAPPQHAQPAAPCQRPDCSTPPLLDGSF